MNAAASASIMPVHVADLLAEGERIPVYAHVIAIVVNTHLHFDHCGGNHLFAGKPIYVQRRELDDARNEDDYTIREWVDARARTGPGTGLARTRARAVATQLPLALPCRHD